MKNNPKIENENLLKLLHLSLLIVQKQTLKESVKVFVDALQAIDNHICVSVWIYSQKLNKCNTSKDLLSLVYSNPKGYYSFDSESDMKFMYLFGDTNNKSFTGNISDDESVKSSGWIQVFKLKEIGYFEIYTKSDPEKSVLGNELFIDIIEKFAELLNSYLKNYTISGIKHNRIEIAKSQYLENVSHEIRNNLSSILGNSELLIDSETDFQKNIMLSELKLSAESLLTTMNNVLDLSKIELGKITLEKTSFNLYDAIVDTLTIFTARHVKSLKIKFESGDGIPEYIYADKQRIQQILFNVIYSAYQFKSSGSIKLNCLLKENTDNNIRLEFTFNINGEWIDKDVFSTQCNDVESEDKKSLVSKFIDFEVAESLCKLMGGELFVDSQNSNNLVLKFEIVVKPGNNEESIDIKSNIDKKHMLSGKKILVVDDETFNLDVCKRILLNRGGEVLTAYDGQSAIEHISSDDNSIDLIFMDLRMPKLDGIEATKYIRNNLNWKKPIIALTGEAFTEKLKECIMAGMDDFIQKPFYQKQIETKLIKHLELTNLGSDNGDQNKVSNEENLSDVNKIQYSVDTLLNMVDGKEDHLKSLLESLVKQNKGHIDNLNKACEETNWERIQSISHTLKTSLKYLGLKKYADLCQKLENAGRNKDVTVDIIGKSSIIYKVVTEVSKRIQEDYL